MQLFAFPKREKRRSVAIKKKVRKGKAILIFFLAFTLQAFAKNPLQEITLSLNNVRLEAVFKEIQKQTSYRFVYTKEQLENSKKVSVDVKHARIEIVLQLCFKEQPISYTIEDQFIIISLKEPKEKQSIQFIDVIGKVINEQGQIIAGASITVKGTNRGIATDAGGEFILRGIEPDAILVITSIGYEGQILRLQGETVISIQLKIAVASLDETVVIAYGTTTKRLNTGNVGKITSAEISKQPVSNPLAVLEGRVPGLVVVQSNGVPGSSFKLLIRGKNSLAQGSDPLFIIDGVPFAPNNNSINLISAAFSANGGGLSPFNTLNPESIESMEVLKDADATAIYGSRGANGVILITTKKGKGGKSKFTANVYHGNSKVSRTMDYLNTQEYLQMRHEAFTMDGITPNNNNAYDFLLWDTTRYTDFKKLLIGNTAHTTDAQVSFSGGNANTQFLLGGGYHNESTVFAGDFSDEKASFNLNLNHITNDKKFTINLSTIYSYNNNNVSTSDLAGLLLSSIPNLPSLYDSNGKLNWIDKGFYFINPLAFTYQKYSANVKNLIGNLQISYKLTPDIHLIASAGYNNIQTSETRLSPKVAQLPVGNVTGSALFGNSSLQNWLVEPQIKYTKQISKGKLQVLIGSTFQENINDGTTINATGYTSDLLLQTPNAAGSTKVSNNYSKYRYTAVFARINYNWQDKYILNISGRRDGSSRFGPESQFANFGAVGAGWIFSKEAFIAKNFHFLSFGKLRGSYGTSGNDQIGDYKYLDTWQSTIYTYQSSGLTPSSLFNPEYGWELNKKFEIGLELGFLKDKILLSASYFRNRCNNQLISYRLPSQTGFASILKNFPALIQNTGLEFEISSSIIKSRNFSWTSSFNITIPKNELLEFENLSNSSYSSLVIGEPLSVYGGFHFTGVDPATGIYQFADKAGNNTSSPSSTNDWINNLGNLEPKFYGGFNNNFSYKRFSLDVFASFKKQKGPNYLYALSRTVPGTINNQPIVVMERWQKPGSMTIVQRFTQQPSNAAYAAARTFYSYTNDGQFGDASYIRIKNISFSYSFSPKILEKLKLENCFFYVRGQNLFTITNYMGSDPESLNAGALPPLKTFVAGISITF